MPPRRRSPAPGSGCHSFATRRSCGRGFSPSSPTSAANVRRTRWFSTVRLADIFRPARAAETEVDRIDVERALASLPMGDRQVLFMRFYLDLPVEEIAIALGISPAAAKGRIYRACHKLRPDLQEEDLR